MIFPFDFEMVPMGPFFFVTQLIFVHSICMQLLTQSTTNRLYFTASENMISGAWLYLHIRHISTNNTFFLSFEKSSNVSPYPERWDGFDVMIPAIPFGQCEWTLYEGNAGATQPTSNQIIGVVECGLCEILESEMVDTSFDSSIIYFEPNI